jgi:uracil-DNA glycosylase
MSDAQSQLVSLHKQLAACHACPNMIGPVVHGGPSVSRLMLIGQAPGPHEGKFGRPFAWTAGKTMFGWFQQALGVSEEDFREKVYMAAVARCFPGKAKGGGDRKPDPEEISRCRPWLEREVAILKPKLLLPVGTLAIEQVLGLKGPLSDVVGKVLRARYHGVDSDVICLPHPSGASTWHRTEPGKTLLAQALRLVAEHPDTQRTFKKSRKTA